MITSNYSVGKWGVAFGDTIAATVILDRLLQHSHVLTIRGESYRLKENPRAGILPPQYPGSSESVSVQPA